MIRDLSFFTSVILLGSVLHSSCMINDGANSTFEKKPICGLTLVAPPRPFDNDPIAPMKAIHCNWIAVVPYAFTPKHKPEVRFGSNQWWGESPDGAKETIHRAHKAGVNVMLKPQVWTGGWWTGDYHFGNENDWKNWEDDYTAYITHFAAIAQETKVKLLCVGTEFKNAIAQRPGYWHRLIDTIRTIYDGKLIYAANWDNFDQIPFWDKLDYIGINAYFPLSDKRTPSLNKLTKAWQPPLKKIRKIHRKYELPVIFTEYGYLSVDHSAAKTWLLEQRLDKLNENQEAQSVAIDALHTVFSQEPYWQGGFLWKWYPWAPRGNRRRHKDYTPQNKLAEEVLSRWFRM